MDKQFQQSGPVIVKSVETPTIEARPVLDERGIAVLFDLWIASKWVGSKRTIEQCEERLSYLCGAPIEIDYRSGW